MQKKRLFFLRPTVTLAAILVVWLALPVIIKSLVETSFYKFQAPVEVTASYIRDLQEFWGARTHSKTELFKAAQGLARLNASYELAIVENQSLKDEIARVEDLLQLPSRPNYRYEVARIVKRDFNSWWQTIVIRKGTIQGVRNGAAVVFTGGVVGRVRQAYRQTAIVDLLSNGHLRMAAVIEGDNRPMSFRGAGSTGFGQPNGLAEYIPIDVSIVDPQNPPLLITSGMGGVFPPGLKIGVMSNLRPGSSGLFQDATIKLDPRLMSLNEVAVLVPIEQYAE